jgi:hypothetical protein
MKKDHTELLLIAGGAALIYWYLTQKLPATLNTAAGAAGTAAGVSAVTTAKNDITAAIGTGAGLLALLNSPSSTSSATTMGSGNSAADAAAEVAAANGYIESGDMAGMNGP